MGCVGIANIEVSPSNPSFASLGAEEFDAEHARQVHCFHLVFGRDDHILIAGTELRILVDLGVFVDKCLGVIGNVQNIHRSGYTGHRSLRIALSPGSKKAVLDPEVAVQFVSNV